MSRKLDLTGQRFGRLVVLSFHHNENGKRYWLCLCDCGNKKIAHTSHLNFGLVKSCGCLADETRANNRLKKRKHGFSHKERLYETWKNMKRRCCDPSNNRAKFYIEKGIKVCDEWMNDYSEFRQWALSHGYAETLTLDRINNDGDYCPENCRWATAKIQANNQSRNHLLTYNGETLTMSEWADKLGITYATINSRVQHGWSMTRIVNTPQRRSINGHYTTTLSRKTD